LDLFYVVYLEKEEQYLIRTRLIVVESFDTTICTTHNEPGCYSNHLRRKEKCLRLRLLMIEFRKSHVSMGVTIGNPPLVISIHITLNNASNLRSQGTM
jgi:hypothetical protein